MNLNILALTLIVILFGWGMVVSKEVWHKADEQNKRIFEKWYEPYETTKRYKLSKGGPSVIEYISGFRVRRSLGRRNNEQLGSGAVDRSASE